MATKARRENSAAHGAQPNPSGPANTGFALGNFKLPLILITALLLLTFTSRVHEVVLWSFVSAVAVLAAWLVYFAGIVQSACGNP